MGDRDTLLMLGHERRGEIDDSLCVTDDMGESGNLFDSVGRRSVVLSADFDVASVCLRSLQKPSGD